mmetsp:Transcript_27011/g.29097  ORF Transcript_27011/g.29097 Transcript_27011/m.29097 type:complete len:285 (+) Transcript_27011:148-1002(+)
MVGFGIMDNIVMITAGEAIDSTLGVSLGISTMAAAGFGQCFSDVAGLSCGGIVDATVSKFNMKQHGLSSEQLNLRKTRLIATIGACIGVVTGCLLGMTVLLFMDTDRADRAKRSKELKSIFESVMKDGHNLVGAERATLFMVDHEKNELWSQVATGFTKPHDKIIKCPVGEGLVGHAVSTHKTVMVPNAYNDPRFNPEIDKNTGFHTRSVIVVPVFDAKDNTVVIGAIEMMNKKKMKTCDTTTTSTDNDNDDESGIVPFNECDEKLLKVLASHVSSFIRVVDSS